jgi:hypothetical protein
VPHLGLGLQYDFRKAQEPLEHASIKLVWPNVANDKTSIIPNSNTAEGNIISSV